MSVPTLRPKIHYENFIHWKMRSIIRAIGNAPPSKQGGLYHELRMTEELLGILDFYYENKTTPPLSRKERAEIRKAIIEKYDLNLDI